MDGGSGSERAGLVGGGGAVVGYGNRGVVNANDLPAQETALPAPAGTDAIPLQLVQIDVR